jgi:tetratricopeptide (TPR) repeat protein
MAGRVNTKFVVILSAVLVVLVGGIVAAAYMSKRDAQKLAARGEQYLAEGDVKLAVETLERAVGHSKSDPEIIKKYIGAVKQLPAADQVEASNILNTVRAYTLNLVRIDPDSEAYLREYAEQVQETVKRIGVMEGSHPLYIYMASVERLEYNPADELARRYRGVYGYGQLNIEMPEEDIFLVRDDLLWAHEVYPEDTEVANSLAMWKLFEARRMDRPGSDEELRQKLKDEAVALSKSMLDADPGDAKRKLEYLHIVHRATVDPRSEDPYEQVRPLLDELESQLLEDPSPSSVVLTTAQRLKDVYRREMVAEDDPDDTFKTKNVGIRRAITLLRRAIEEHPDDAMLQLVLGTELKSSGDYDQAMSYIQKVKELSTQGEYLDVLLNYRLKQTALIEYADLLITQADAGKSQEDRQAKFAEAGKLVDDAVASGQGEQPRIQLLRGRLALAQGKVREGLIYLDKAAEGYDTYSIDKAQALVLSARARAKQGDWGAAAERYEQILEAIPKFPGIRLELARTYIRQRDFDTAQEHIDVVLAEDPTHEQALVQQAALYAAQDDLDQAIEVYRGLDMTGRPDLAVGLGRLMILGDRKEQAAKMLGLYFEADPSNIQMLALLLLSIEDLDEKHALIAQSRAGGGDEKLLVVLEKQLDPDAVGDPVQVIENFVANEPDPFVRAMSGARLYIRANKIDEARAALSRAEELRPDDRQVIDMRFNFAITDGDLEAAQRYADRAAQMNLDEASGGFYMAQVQLAKQQYVEAIETLRAALEEVPINSDGWRVLGEMYVATSNDAEAVSAFERSLKQRPDNLGSIKGLAAIRNRQGRHDEALGMLRFANNRYPDNVMLRDLFLAYEGKYGDKQAALRLRREVAEDDPENSSNKRALALLLVETGQEKQGLEMIQGLVDSEGRTAINLQTLALVHRYSGDIDEGALVLRQNILSRGGDVTSADHIMLARYLLQAKDIEGAVASFQKAIEVESDRREATRALAGLYFSRQAYVQALPYYRELHEQFPEEKPIGLGLAEVLIKTQHYDDASVILDGIDGGTTEVAQRALIAESAGDHAEAIRLVNSAIEADPGKAGFYYERAALQIKDPDRAGDVIKDLNTSLSLDPNHLASRRMLIEMYLRGGEKREAMREMRTMVSRHPDYAKGRLDLIQMHVREGEMSRAKTLARAGIEQNPDEAAWHSVLGGLAASEGDIQGAIESYSKVLEMSPSPVNLLNLATVQIENGRASDAQSVLREYAEIVNQQPLLQAVMARSLYATGKEGEARQVFTLAAERCKTFDQLFGVAAQVRKDYSLAETVSLMEGLTNPPSRVWVDLALARLEVSEGESQAVITRLGALEGTLSEEDAGVRQVVDQIMGPALHDVGRGEEALVYYRRVQAVSPDNTSVLNNMAYLLAEDLGKAQEALPLAQRAAEIEPRNAQILDTLGWVQFKLGQVDEAQRTLQQSIEAESLSANHLHMAELLIDKGYGAEAGRHLKTAVDLAEQNNESQLLERAKELLKQTDELTEASVTP